MVVGIYQAASEHCVFEDEVLEAGKMSKRFLWAVHCL